MSHLAHDIRYACRTLLRAPGFTAIAIVTLALGIGANTAIFSVVNAVLLRPLPYHAPDELVTVEHFYPSLNNMQAPVSAIGFEDYRKLDHLFSGMAVEGGWAPNLTGSGDPERLIGQRVAGDLFGVLDVPAQLGRGLRPDEGKEGPARIVVVSQGFWQRVLGGDPGVVGRRLLLDGESYEVVGVMPAGFRDFWNRRVELWAPLTFRPEQLSDNARTNEYLSLTARLAPGVTPAQAQRELTGFASRLVKDYPDAYASDWTLKLTTLTDNATAGSRTALWVLLGAVGLVLLIACANVANLQLARASARGREIAVRVALGASPSDLVRQLLTESVLLALAGGVLGLLLAVWGVPALIGLGGRGLPPASEIGMEGVVLAYTLGISLLTGLLFGLAPALQVSRTSLQETLKEGGRGSAGGRRSQVVRRGLVVATVALALTLLAGAGLLVRSFSRLLGVSPGFAPDHLLTFAVNLPNARYSNDTLQVEGIARVVAAVSAVPGVLAAGGTSNIPFGGNWSTSSFSVEGYQVPANTPSPWGDVRVVTPGYLETIQAPLRTGRLFTAEDRADGRQVAVVDETVVAKYWPGQDPIGKRITFDDPTTASTVRWIEVVGVVGHTMHEGLDGDRRVQVYRPVAQVPLPFIGVVARTAGDPLTLSAAVRAAVRSVDADLPVSNLTTMEQLISGTTGPRRFSMLLLGIFSGFAVILASVGLYGVMSFLVTHRAKELGVRLALGAGRQDVLRLVLGQGMRLALLGVAIGVVAALALSRIIRSLLFDVSATDPLTFVVIPLLLLGVTLIASWIPARRAMRVDPVVALRGD
jgi:putative ABC transport system permease protein